MSFEALCGVVVTHHGMKHAPRDNIAVLIKSAQSCRVRRVGVLRFCHVVRRVRRVEVLRFCHVVRRVRRVGVLRGGPLTKQDKKTAETRRLPKVAAGIAPAASGSTLSIPMRQS